MSDAQLPKQDILGELAHEPPATMPPTQIPPHATLSPNSALLGASDVRRLAAQSSINPSKRLGQNFVIDPGTVRRIVREAGVRPDGPILEVGPGLGSLTLALLEAGARVTAVEIDTRLAKQLPDTVSERMPKAIDRLNVINTDALDLEPDDLEGTLKNEPFTLVANLPYNVATPIILTLLERFGNLESFLVMVQREVADRLVATPGTKTYGAPSVKLAWYGRAERAGLIGRNVFWPAPNVDSALVRLSRVEFLSSFGSDDSPQQIEYRTSGDTGSPPKKSESVRRGVFQLIDKAFAQRRKTLHAALKGVVPETVFACTGIDPTRRGETLSIKDFTALYLATVSNGPANERQQGTVS